MILIMSRQRQRTADARLQQVHQEAPPIWMYLIKSLLFSFHHTTDFLAFHDHKSKTRSSKCSLKQRRTHIVAYLEYATDLRALISWPPNTCEFDDK